MKNQSKTILTGILSLLTFAAPILLLSSTYFTHYGVFSISPASGSFLVTRWGDLVSCSETADPNREIIAEVVSEVCNGSPDQIPGDGINLLWQGTSVGKTLDERINFVRNQEDLTEIAFKGILKNKSEFVKTLVKDYTYPLTHFEEPNDLGLYISGNDWRKPEVVKKNFLNYNSWFDRNNSEEQQLGANRLKSLIEATLFIPRTLMYCFLIVFCLRSIEYRIRNKHVSIGQWVRFFNTKFHFQSKIAILYVVTVGLMASVSTIRNFRFELGQIPIWILLIAITINKFGFKIN
jgi:hypothetical protein